MEFEENFTGYTYKMGKNNLMSKITLKRVNIPSQNSQILRRAKTTKVDVEKANYLSDLIWEQEKVNLDEKEMFNRKTVSVFKFYFTLFEPLDWLFFVLGMIGCLASGISTPLIYYLNAEVFTNVGKTSEGRGSLTEEQLMKETVKDKMNSNIKKQLIYGSIALLDNFIAYFFIGLLCTRCLYNFKKRYFKAIFSQEQAWFDSTNIYIFASKVQAQVEFIDQGMNETFANTIVKCCVFLGCLIFAFIGSWKLSLVLLCILPFMIIITFLIIKSDIKGGNLSRDVFELAGSILEEILYNIRVICSFANFDYELKRFYEKTEITANLEKKMFTRKDIYLSLLYFAEVLAIFIGIMYGRTLVKKDYNSVFGRDTSGGDITLTFNCMVNMISSVVDLSNNFGIITRSLAASSDFFNLIERKPEMDLTNSTEKPPLDNIKGNIEFNNVNFYYPSDINKKLVLNGINLNFMAGKKIALIGETGSGKTTIANLIERLYDRTSGDILLDGLDITKYDIQYLRNLIGYVEQEPILFNRSIRDNIIFGREKNLLESNEDINELIRKACDEAYVSEFLDKVPDGLDYVVGIKGNKLSGGQKQRIAIARAILIKPKILILDEATSALDNKSEQIVQKALDNISKKNITTIFIAHKLNTIRNADLIYVLKEGQVYEQGTHEELLLKGGYYEKMIRPQLLREELENYNKKDEYIRKMTSMKRVNTNDEVHFERKDEELSLSPDNVKLNFCKILKILMNDKCHFIFALISSIIYGVFPILKGYFLGKGITAITSKYQAIRYDDGLKFSIIYLIIGILYVIGYFCFYYSYYYLGIDLTKIYRNYLLKKFLSVHLAFFDIDRNYPGSLASRMTIDTIQLKSSFKLIIGNLITSISTFITALIFGVCYEYRLTLITIVFLPLLIIITIIRRFSVQVDSPKSLAASAEGGRILSECTTGSKTIFSYNFSQEALRLYLAAIDYITQRQYLDNFINSLSLSLLTFCNYMYNAIIFAVGKRYILNNSLNSDEMTVIHSIIGQGFSTIAANMKTIWRIRKAIASLRSIYSILDTESLINPFDKDNINKLSANNIKGKIEFRNVFFAYPFKPEHIILKDISFTILPGQKVALVGNSGCGKSSIIQLMNRFYDVEEGKGEILIDDVNIKDYNLFELKKKIGFVQQEPSAFKISNLENIRYGKLDATDEECYEAAKKVNALNILERDNDKNLKEKNITSGDKQKLAIARIFLKNPPILLLDEPTSTLDKESELEIEKSLDILSKDKTTITIAHRLNTIENCDKIIVFDDGRIKEQGTHDELMKLKKRYYTLHKYSNLG